MCLGQRQNCKQLIQICQQHTGLVNHSRARPSCPYQTVDNGKACAFKRSHLRLCVLRQTCPRPVWTAHSQRLGHRFRQIDHKGGLFNVSVATSYTSCCAAVVLLRIGLRCTSVRKLSSGSCTRFVLIALALRTVKFLWAEICEDEHLCQLCGIHTTDHRTI